MGFEDVIRALSVGLVGRPVCRLAVFGAVRDGATAGAAIEAGMVVLAGRTGGNLYVVVGWHCWFRRGDLVAYFQEGGAEKVENVGLGVGQGDASWRVLEKFKRRGR